MRIFGMIKRFLDILWTYILVALNAFMPNCRLIVGKNALIALGSVVIGNVVIEDHVYIGPRTHITGYVRIGRGTRINGDSWISGGSSPESGVYIGNYCAIARGLTILAMNHNYTCVPVQFALARKLNVNPSECVSVKGPVYIGHDVWIGYHVTILSGASIGNGAVVGACSVVTSKIPPYSIAVGVPARVVKERFPKTVASLLDKSKWWELSPTELKKIAHAFGRISKERAEELLSQVQKIRKGAQ